ncbi:MAG TPA: nodulation protein NfeD [Steroidobacteraceae bacterium]|jgi:Membrane-bound serine protease (ClpP class)|nr:nodulation protein NfeD [Steroidobacteraceae bacterium]
MLLCAFALVFTGASSAQQPAAGQAQAEGALLLEIRDAIGPATSDFFVRSLDRARERKVRLVIVQLDTPGGLDSAMRDMIRALLASPVPVAIYVSPSGARAASAGTYLLYASHVAAMAPATNLGAATPVRIGAPSEPSSPRQPEAQGDQDKDAKPESGTAEERKAINDSVAYIRGLAELRGRNADWAESAVRAAASLPASAALEQNVIDIVASDVADLLGKIDGRVVKVSTGELRLATRSLVVQRIDPDWRTRLLAVLTNPNVAYLLMLVGIYGLLLEGYNPGAVLPGVVGAICLLLALYAFQVLSVNYAGLGLILLGLALLVGEAFVPSFGSLGIGGVAAFVIGSIILLDTGVPGFEVARSLIGGIALAGALLVLLLASYFTRSRKRPVVTGAEQLLVEPAIALRDFARSGPVRVRGEIWDAIARAPVKEGQRLRIVRVDGLRLEVEPDERSE